MIYLCAYCGTRIPIKTVMRHWLTVTILMVCVAYYLYIPLPDNAAEPWKQRFTFAAFKVMGDISSLAGMFGFSQIKTLRNGMECFNWVNWLYSSPITDVETKRDVFDGVEVRIYYPPKTNNELLPGMVYLHGGGWCVNTADSYEILNKEMTKMANVVTVFVEYRRAPENKFPAAFEDCLKATIYLLRNAEKFGVNKDRIGVAGDSAGGNLALAVSLKISEEPKQGLPSLRLQGLIYPTIQALDFSLTSFNTFDVPQRQANTLVTKHLMILWVNMYAFGHLKYMHSFFNNSHITSATKKKYRKFVDPSILSKEFGTTSDDNIESSLLNVKEVEKIILNPYFAPLMMTDEQMRKLQRTLIMTCDLDGLKDEGFILAERMRRVNVQMVHKHYDGADHAFMFFTYYDTYRESLQDLVSYIKNNI